MMEEKNDLMKNIGSGDENKLRKYLILGGGVFILFVVGIVVSKFMFSDAKKNNDTSVILPPEITKPVNKIQKKEDTALFNDIPVENDTAQQQQEESSFQKPAIEDEKLNKTNKKSETQTKNIASKEEVKQNKEPIQDIPEPMDEVTEVKKEPKQERVTQPKIKENIKKEVKKTPKKVDIPRYYYIQVAAITRGKPSNKFLNLIKKNGFNYKIVEVKVNGMNVKRILIGAYSYKEAKSILGEVKQKISSSAFIKRLK